MLGGVPQRTAEHLESLAKRACTMNEPDNEVEGWSE
jgi:hypothetical protein